MSGSYKDVAASEDALPQNNDTSLHMNKGSLGVESCVRAIYNDMQIQKKQEQRVSCPQYPHQEHAFLFERLYNDLRESCYDDGFMTKSNKDGFFRAILPHLNIEKTRHHYSQEDATKPANSATDSSTAVAALDEVQ